ncbi:MAG TPA: hypothetical protein VFR18_11315 [Terriglobia bacterium]|nr:hypothetical protein [Terriglobia bacterium]
MAARINAEPVDSTYEDSARWLAASLIWLVAGFAFPFLAPATASLSAGLTRYLSTAAGMDEELAFRVAFTIFRLPLAAFLAIGVAAVQGVLLRSIRPVIRRWLFAAAIGASIATLIYLPSGLLAIQIAGDPLSDVVNLLLLVPGAGMHAGLVSILQRRAGRRKVFVPGRFIVISILAAALGAFIGFKAS